MELRRAGTNWGALMRRTLERLDALGARILFPKGDAAPELRCFVVFLLGHVAVWTLYAWLSHNNLSSSADLTEAYAWGREFEWGYHKHPPLSAWIAAAWFELMPRSDWAYFLLAALIVAIGYAGVWALVGLLETGPRRLVSVIALEFSPIYGFLAIRFNANSVLLALWPWATWAFLRAVRNPTLLNGALLGLALAAALLAKYYSLVLIIGMLAALLVGENRWRLLTSPAMAGAVAAGALALAPHLVWLVQSDFAPIRYADDQTANSLGQFFGYLIKFPLAQLLYVAPIVAVAALALPKPERIVSKSLFAWASVDDDRRRILALGIVPFLATMALGVVTFSQLSTIWGIPLWFLTGWILLSSPGIAAHEVNAPRIAALVVLFWAVLIAIAPAVNLASTVLRPGRAALPLKETALAATSAWREATGGRPLRLVGGDDIFAPATVFYSKDDPSWYDVAAPAFTPWAGPDRIAREGVAVLCPLQDRLCIQQTRQRLGPDLSEREITAAKRAWWGRLPAHTVLVLMRLPDRSADAPPAR
jgi:Dolichyl-phosphate-mannose-protein mannosyltransferase